MNFEQRKKLLSEKFEGILTDVRGGLSENEIKDILDFFDHNEWGVAYEILCAQLGEYDVAITKSTFKKIENLGKLMDVDSKYWLSLLDQIKDESLRLKNG